MLTGNEFQGFVALFRTYPDSTPTLGGIEAMSMIRKGQVKGISQGDSLFQAKFIEELFGMSV